jgi:hypothetical protein
VSCGADVGSELVLVGESLRHVAKRSEQALQCFSCNTIIVEYRNVQFLHFLFPRGYFYVDFYIENERMSFVPEAWNDVN